MSLPPRRAACIPGTPASLCVLVLLLLLLTPRGPLASGAPVVSELRCQCLQTSQGIHLKNIQSVKVTPAGPHCAQIEVIVTLKSGQEVCLNPEAPMVKKIIDKILNNDSAN
ncbi:C-X-C motif chemokine 2 [Manis javanica]|nr:C-X-C motif chemokine 2 [Manis javanica]